MHSSYAISAHKLGFSVHAREWLGGGNGVGGDGTAIQMRQLFHHKVVDTWRIIRV